MLFVILVFLCAVLTFYYFVYKDYNFWKKQNIVQEHGILWKFTFGNRSLAEVFKDVYDRYPNEKHVGIFLGSKPALLLRDLENIQTVLAREFQNFSSRGFDISKSDVLADNVLFINDFARWKILRQKVSPVFTSLKLKNMFYIIERCARDFVDMVKVNPRMKEKPFNAVYTYTTASIGASVFGIDTTTKNTMDSPFMEMAWKSTKSSFFLNCIFLVAELFPKFFQLIDFKIFGEFEEFFVGAVRRVLDNRRNNPEKRHDFIDICLELQKQGVMRDSTNGYEIEPTVEVLAAQAFFFFIAGADTSANTMHFTLLELSKNPHILEKVHEEIDEVFKSCNEELTYNDIEKLKYLEMVSNEAIRRYPPIGFLQRQCTKDTTLPVGNVKIKKDTLVIIPVYAIHNDEKYFPDPEVFDPERFSPENVSKQPNFAYLAFGEGNRVCLGTRFARLQVKAGLAWLLRRFTLREQSDWPKKFEPSGFSLCVRNARYDLIPRNLLNF